MNDETRIHNHQRIIKSNHSFKQRSNIKSSIGSWSDQLATTWFNRLNVDTKRHIKCRAFRVSITQNSGYGFSAEHTQWVSQPLFTVLHFGVINMLLFNFEYFSVINPYDFNCEYDFLYFGYTNAHQRPLQITIIISYWVALGLADSTIGLTSPLWIGCSLHVECVNTNSTLTFGVNQRQIASWFDYRVIRVH